MSEVNQVVPANPAIPANPDVAPGKPADPNAPQVKAAKADNTKKHPENIRVPDSVLIKRHTEEELTGTEIEKSPTVRGDKALMIMDVLQGTPIFVSLIQGVGLTPDDDGRLIFVQGTVSNETLPVKNANAKFAVKKDGTIIYNSHGFDDVAQADFDMVDIAKLIAYNNSDEGKAADKKAKADAKVRADKARADEKAAADKAKAVPVKPVVATPTPTPASAPAPVVVAAPVGA